jgi:hypothetical protein
MRRDRLRRTSSEHSRFTPARFGRYGLVAWVAFSAWLAGGCARVAPYERETLARRDMQPADNPDLTAGEEHARAYREGSIGGGEAKGGGCGCN